MYRAVVQSILLFGSKSCDLSTQLIAKLEAFNNRVAMFITRQFIRPGADGEWIYPSSTELLEQCGLITIRNYIEKWQDNAKSKYLLSSPFYLSHYHSLDNITSSENL